MFGLVTCLMIFKRWFTNFFIKIIGDNYDIYNFIIIIIARMCENTMKCFAYTHCTNFTLQLHGKNGKKS